MRDVFICHVYIYIYISTNFSKYFVAYLRKQSSFYHAQSTKEERTFRFCFQNYTKKGK